MACCINDAFNPRHLLCHIMILPYHRSLKRRDQIHMEINTPRRRFTPLSEVSQQRVQEVKDATITVA